MTRFRVRASGPLAGRVQPSGATKNAGLKQMAAALLAPGVTTLRNMPTVRDLDVMIDLLRATGAVVDQPAPDVVRDRRERRAHTRGAVRARRAHARLVQRARAAARALRSGAVALPGGDNIGSRKVDMHLRGLEAMGAEVEVAHGYVVARAELLHGARTVLEFPSVGATENLMCAAVLAKGTTVIENAAREPEVTALATFLNRMGAHLLGADRRRSRSKASKSCTRSTARSWPTGSRRARCSWRAASRAARSSSSAFARSTSRWSR